MSPESQQFGHCNRHQRRQNRVATKVSRGQVEARLANAAVPDCDSARSSGANRHAKVLITILTESESRSRHTVRFR